MALKDFVANPTSFVFKAKRKTKTSWAVINVLYYVSGFQVVAAVMTQISEMFGNRINCFYRNVAQHLSPQMVNDYCFVNAIKTVKNVSR